MKRKIKILATPGHITETGVAGVDFARVIQPMEHLGKHPDFQVDILTPELDKFSTVRTWYERAQKYDVFYLNYNNNPQGFAAMGCMAKKCKKLIVTDLDDNLWNIKPDNTAFHTFKKGSDGLRTVTAIFNESDYLTCTNQYLKNVICFNTNIPHQKVKVFPNYIDLDLYKHRCKTRDDFDIKIVHFGSTSHFADLANKEFMDGLGLLFNEYPNVHFKTIGAFISEFRNRFGKRYSHGYGSQSLYTWVKDKYPEFMDDADIFVTPLVDDIYTMCKSSIKFIEVSAAKIPGVWQDMRQYREVIKHGKNGYLAKTADDWYRHIKALVDSVALRKKMGENAFKTVEKDWQMKDRVEDYANFFRRIVDKNQNV